MPDTVALTRPLESRSKLAALLLQQNIPHVVCPLISIVPQPVDEPMKRSALQLDLYDHVVFVSQHAARFGMALFEQYWPQWPHIHFYSVGAATNEELGRYDLVAQSPENADSEGLLALPALQSVANQKVLIVRGIGGRPLIHDVLTDRGAVVDYLQVYRRERATIEEVRHCLADHSIGYATITSQEILTVLQGALTRDEVVRLTLFVASNRIAQAAAELGFGSVVNVGSADDQTMFDAIVKRVNKENH